MSDLIKSWKERKDKKREQYKKLKNRLQSLNEKKLNQCVLEINDSVFEQIDCLMCANCCKSIPPIINENDIRRISKYLGLKTTEFKTQFVKYDEDMDMVMNNSPCPFLMSDNYCQIYEIRPKACREYPHTDDFDFHRKLKLHITNTSYCPAVFYIMEELQKKFL